MTSHPSPSIDVHHHFYPGGKDNEGHPWSVRMSLDELDRNGIRAAIASLPPIGGAGTAQARAWNEWAAALCRDHPARFGLFATLPLRDVDACLAEIAYAYDVLHVDGIGLPTSDVDVWLSDARFAPMFAELNRRRAVVFAHPYSTSRCRDVSQEYGGGLASPPWLEFPTNTARLILGLLIAGVTRACPDIRFIFCHGGGTMPSILGRISGFDGWRTVGRERLDAAFPDGIYAEFARLHFDCAQAYAPETMATLLRLAGPSQLLFGSDYSYFPVSHSVAQLAALALDDGVIQAVGGGNAARLFPRFADTSAA